MSASLPRRVEPLPLAMAVRTGSVVVRQGEPTTATWRVDGGALWESVVLPDGRELALGVLGPGDVIGEPGGAPSAGTVRALKVSRLRPVDPSDAADLFAARARRAASLAAELAWSDVPSRVLSRLRDLAERFGRPAEDGALIPFGLTQDHIALLAGSTRESVSRSMRTLAAEGHVRVAGHGRYVVIHEPAPIQAPPFGRPGVQVRLDLRAAP